jgi:hypothetical protein
LFAQSRQRQQNLSKRPQVVATIGCDLDLLEPAFLLPWIPAKPRESFFGPGKLPMK